MANHLVLSRKYRPQRFEDLVGQEAVAQTLRNAISSGRIGHAYLFIGPRGTGKTTTARIFAKALNCESGPTATPCGTCSSCVGITSGNDLDVVEMDAASNNGVDDVRALRDSVGYRPARSRFRIWIVDEVHMLSLAAFNAFLKTLEEPPPQAKFLFCTTEAHKLPETFTSRVQRLEFRRIEEPRMADRLRSLVEREGLGVEEGVCERIAQGALGGLRDAESLLEQLLACAAGGRVTHADLDAVSGRAGAREVEALFAALLAGDPGRALEAAGACLDGGAKPDVVLDQVVDGFRALLPAAARAAPQAGVAPTVSRGQGDSAVPAASAAAGPLDPLAAGFGLPRILRSIDLLLEKRRALRDGADARLVVEVASVELASLPSARNLERLLEALEVEVRRGPVVPGGGRGPSGAGSSGTGSSGPVTGGWAAPGTAGGAHAAGAYAPRAGGASADPAGGGAASSASSSPPRAPAASAPTFADSPTPAAVAAAAGGCAVPGASGAGPATVPTEEVVARWAEIVQAGVRRSRRLASCLGKARLVGVVGDVALLSIPETESIARGVLRDREATDAFREAAREVLGVGLRAALDEGGSRPVGPGPVRPSGGAPGGAPSRGPVPAAGGRVAAADASGPRPSGAGGSLAASPAPQASGLGGGAGPSGVRAPSATGPAGSTGERLDDLRARPDVKAVLDAFGARVLAIQRVEPPAPPATDVAGARAEVVGEDGGAG